jgi:hypothetical protein
LPSVATGFLPAREQSRLAFLLGLPARRRGITHASAAKASLRDLVGRKPFLVGMNLLGIKPSWPVAGNQIGAPALAS